MRAIITPYLYTDPITGEKRMNYAIRLYDDYDELICRIYKSQTSLEKAEIILEKYFPQFSVEVAPERTTTWETV
jgi:hypothetical protein